MGHETAEKQVRIRETAPAVDFTAARLHKPEQTNAKEISSATTKRSQRAGGGEKRGTVRAGHVGAHGPSTAPFGSGPAERLHRPRRRGVRLSANLSSIYLFLTPDAALSMLRARPRSPTLAVFVTSGWSVVRCLRLRITFQSTRGASDPQTPSRALVDHVLTALVGLGDAGSTCC